MIQRSKAYKHYQQHPFDVADEANHNKFIMPFFIKFAQNINMDMHILEAGVGGGRNTQYLDQCGFFPIVIDITREALDITQAKIRKQLPKYLADNTEMPFKDNSFDRVISDGVIHHNRDYEKCMAELSRVTRRNGLIFLAVYKSPSAYKHIYNTLGIFVRNIYSSEKFPAYMKQGIFLMYQLFLTVKARLGRNKWPLPKNRKQLMNRFSDYFLAPIYKFFTFQEIVELSKENDLKLESYDWNYGTTAAYILRKI